MRDLFRRSMNVNTDPVIINDAGHEIDLGPGILFFCGPGTARHPYAPCIFRCRRNGTRKQLFAIFDSEKAHRIHCSVRTFRSPPSSFTGISCANEKETLRTLYMCPSDFSDGS